MSESELKLIGWLNDIKAAKGKAKQAWLVEFSKSESPENVELMKDFLRRCYEPSITYGISAEELSVPRVSRGNMTWTDLCELCNKLADRTYTGNEALSRIRNFKDASPIWLFAALIRILERDAKCGIGVSTINKVWPNLISCFDVMLAAQYDEDKITFPCYIEPKFDGMRMVAVESKSVGMWDFFTRSGKPIETVSADVSRDLTALASNIRERDGGQSFGLMFDGELMGESFRETMSQARKKDSTFETANYHVFDWLRASAFFALEEVYKHGQTYKERRFELTAAFAKAKPTLSGRVKLPATYIVGSIAELHRYYQTVRNDGLEGLIIKRGTGLYRPSRHHDWIKMKAEETLDLPIIGAERGTGKYADTLGALVVSHKGVPVNVGTGISDSERDHFWKMWRMDPESLKGTLAEVSFQEVTPDNSLRHPRFVRLRSDKTTPESAWS